MAVWEYENHHFFILLEDVAPRAMHKQLVKGLNYRARLVN